MTPEHWNAVVVGSGFGGSTIAYRLAEAGLSVCLLERGKAYPPGSFPRSPLGIRRNFWDPSDGDYGMFNVWSFKGIEGLVSSGLGGGSLIYANVLLRKDEKWFIHEDHGGAYEHWPVKYCELVPHYEHVEKLMAPQKFPLETAPYDATAKTLALKQASEALGLDWKLVPLAVKFANPGEPPAAGMLLHEDVPNLHGRTRVTCTLCGECDIGCNYGAKNTLDYTHLSAVHRRDNAEIRTLCEVKSFAPRQGGGFTIEYAVHDPKSPSKKNGRELCTRRTITADRLILSAGTFGSPFLLLKNRSGFPHLSDCIGSRFSGNGDLLGFFLRSCADGKSRLLDAGRGPVITSAVRGADELDGTGAKGRGFYIEDAGHPEFVNWLVEATQAKGLVKRLARFAWRRITSKFTGDPKSDITEEIQALLGDCSFSSSSMAVLGMGRDVADGKMKLHRGNLDIDWSTKTSKPYFDRINGAMKDIAGELNAKFRVNPTWYLRRVITVHPLGGCPMGRDEREGVVDSYGEVFNYPGLYVADGSVMPGPVGANPSLTIAALADRTAEQILRQTGRLV
jgi:cholesterol oxidase